MCACVRARARTRARVNTPITDASPNSKHWFTTSSLQPLPSVRHFEEFSCSLADLVKTKILNTCIYNLWWKEAKSGFSVGTTCDEDAEQTPSTGLPHPSSMEEGAGKRCSESNSKHWFNYHTLPPWRKVPESDARSVTRLMCRTTIRASLSGTFLFSEGCRKPVLGVWCSTYVRGRYTSTVLYC